MTRHTMISIIKIVEDTTTDGPGFRTAIYAAGCPNACPGCHNPQSWNISAGSMMSTDDIMDVIKSDEFADVTFSGGDPMFQPEGFADLARCIKTETGKNIWCYTGYKFENLKKNSRQSEVLKYIDVLVDGPYMEAERDTDAVFKGSRNQRIIDVQASLRAQNVVLWQPTL